MSERGVIIVSLVTYDHKQQLCIVLIAQKNGRLYVTKILVTLGVNELCMIKINFNVYLYSHNENQLYTPIYNNYVYNIM